MNIGDSVVAYLKQYTIGVLGTIIGKYCIDEVPLYEEDKWKTRKVQWNHKSMYGWDFRDELSEDVKAVLSQRPTVVELNKNQYEEIEKLVLAP